MAFVVEDGTGLPNANAYIDVAFGTSYFADKGDSVAWGNNSTLQQQAIVNATQYMDLRWGDLLNGELEIKDPMQSLALPLTNFYNRYGQIVIGIPTKWKQACAEYALISLTTVLLPNPTVDKSGQTVLKKKEVIGPIERNFEFSSTNSALIKAYPLADNLVSIYLKSSSSNRVVR